LGKTALIVANDTHCGGTTGLLPPHGVTTDDGNVLLPNVPQEWIWERWDEAARQADKLTQHCERRHIILNGDLIDGWHHGTWQVLSANPTIQRRVAKESLSPLTSLRHDKLFIVRGTPAHVGEQGHVEEDLAELLGAERCPETNAYSRWRLEFTCRGTKVLVYHHGKSGMGPRTQQAAFERLAWDLRMDYDKNGLTPPDLVFVAHRHIWGESPRFSCPTRVFMSPGWQWATQYVHKNIHGAGVLQVGMWVAILDDDAPPEVKEIAFKPRTPKVEEIE